MPRRVFDNFLRKLTRHIKTVYTPGDRYLTVRMIADQFGVSLQTAQRGVSELRLRGIVAASPRSGITIVKSDPAPQLSNKRIVLLSNRSDRRFNEAFLAGVNDVAQPAGIPVELCDNTCEDTGTTMFGDYLLSIKAEGVIALAFPDAALGFYYAMSKGLDIVTDIILDEVPQLPSVQTDNYHHAREAGVALTKRGYDHCLAVGYYPAAGNRRLDGLRAGFTKKNGSFEYACLSSPESMRTIDQYFYFFDSHKAVFSADYSTNYVLAAKFHQYDIPVTNNNFLIYDSEEDEFNYPGLAPVEAIAPSLRTIGRNLAETLIAKWINGSFPLPLQKKI